jgi:hypothetical protein
MRQRIKSIRSVIKEKGKQYGSDRDRLYQLNKAAMLLGKTPKQVCLSYMSKHLTALMCWIEEDSDISIEQWEEKIGDSINYLIILETLVKKETKNETKDATVRHQDN